MTLTRFGVLVCPHAGGAGVIHLRHESDHPTSVTDVKEGILIDYVAVPGSMERNVLEYIDQLHEHFVYPCSISKKGRYNVLSNPDEGYRCVHQHRIQWREAEHQPKMRKTSIAQCE